MARRPILFTALAVALLPAGSAAAGEKTLLEELRRLAQAGHCAEAEARLSALRQTEPGAPRPPLWLQLADARVQWCQRRCKEARSLVESFLRDSERVVVLEEARQAVLAPGGLRDDVQACVARQRRALTWSLIGGVGGGLLLTGLTAALVLRFPPATSPSAGVAMASPALQLAVRF